jgi:aryl-alcohol dehydrogenase-like predicted oxidoreductase
VQKRKLGNSNLEVSAIGLGWAGLGWAGLGCMRMAGTEKAGVGIPGFPTGFPTDGQRQSHEPDHQRTTTGLHFRVTPKNVACRYTV